MNRDFVALTPVGTEVNVDLVAFSRRALVKDGLAAERQRIITADLEAVIRLLVLVALQRECRG